MRTKYVCIGGLAAAVAVCAIATVIVITGPTSTHQPVMPKPSETSVDCSRALPAKVVNDMSFAETSVSRIIGAAQCLLEQTFPTVVITSGTRRCTMGDRAFDLVASDHQTIAFCDEGLFITQSYVETLRPKHTATQWFRLAIGAVNLRFPDPLATMCAGGFITRQAPGFAKHRQEFLANLSVEAAEAQQYIRAGVDFYEKGVPIAACDQAPYFVPVQTIRMEPGAMSPASAATLLA